MKAARHVEEANFRFQVEFIPIWKNGYCQDSGVITFIGLLSMVVYTLFLNKIGKKDEYSLKIRLNVTNNMFIALVITFIVFFIVVPDGFIHYKQIIAALIAITALVGAISTIYYYRRDFKS